MKQTLKFIISAGLAALMAGSSFAGAVDTKAQNQPDKAANIDKTVAFVSDIAAPVAAISSWNDFKEAKALQSESVSLAEKVRKLRYHGVLARSEMTRAAALRKSAENLRSRAIFTAGMVPALTAIAVVTTGNTLLSPQTTNRSDKAQADTSQHAVDARPAPTLADGRAN